MKIKMGSLSITEYCSSDKRKYHFKKEMMNDPAFSIFVTSYLDEIFEKDENISVLEPGHSYIITEGKTPVGYIRLNPTDEEKVIDLHYGVLPEYRKKHYGTSILKQVRNYLLEIENYKNIELHISDKNIASLKCAKRAGYRFDREINNGFQLYKAL